MSSTKRPEGRAASLRGMLRNPFRRSSPVRNVTPDATISAISRAEGADNDGHMGSRQLQTDTGSRSSPDRKEPDKVKKKSLAAPPLGTVDYIVTEGDNLRSLAAQFDTVPSVLRKLNRLTMDFLYPGQVLRIPGPDYVSLNTKPIKPPPPQEPTERLSYKQKAFPGHVIRTEASCHSIVDELELPPRPLSTDEAEYLDQECFERFIKLNSLYITEHNGPVDGVLLVTPNAVMFDPNVSNPRVIEKGAEEFGMIAKMDSVMSAAIYHDIDAMEYLQRRKKDPTVARPPVYHSADCSAVDIQSEPVEGLIADTSRQQDDIAVQQQMSCSCGSDPAQTKDTDISETDIALGAEAPPSTSCSQDATTPEPLKTSPSFSLGDAVLLNPLHLANSINSNTPSGSQMCFGAQSQSVDTDNAVEESSSHAELETNSDRLKCSGFTNPPGTVGTLEASTLYQAAADDKEAIGSAASGIPAAAGEGSVVYDDLLSHEFAIVEYDLVCKSQTVGKSCFYLSHEEEPVLDSHVGDTEGLDLKHDSGIECRPANNVELHGAVQLSDKPRLFESLNEMMPNGLVTDNLQQAALEPSLYLCLRVGQPINNSIDTTCPIESYSKKKRPEYWFSIPRDKVDYLYAFFIQWKSEAYDNDDFCGNELGFVAITEEDRFPREDGRGSPAADLRTLHLGRQVSLDWEIISYDEVRRRKTVEDIERYIPLPELKSESQILDEGQIKQLLQCLPVRVEGYPWALAFGSEEHGFSLSQLYRNLHNVNSPVLLVILTTTDQIFGALSSCAFHTSDSFYGTGESFLFTFVDGYKTYPWNGTNNFFNKGDHSSLSIGSGDGSYGIWIDGDIYLGRTQNCLTYANDPLTGDEEDFHIKQLEVWCFHDE